MSISFAHTFMFITGLLNLISRSQLLIVFGILISIAAWNPPGHWLTIFNFAWLNPMISVRKAIVYFILKHISRMNLCTIIYILFLILCNYFYGLKYVYHITFHFASRRFNKKCFGLWHLVCWSQYMQRRLEKSIKIPSWSSF